MYKISELEEKWKRYNRSRMIIYLLSLVSVLLVILMFVLSIMGVFSDNKSDSSEVVKQEESKSNSTVIPEINKDDIKIKYVDEEVEKATKKAKKIKLEISENKISDGKIADIKKRFEFSQDPQDSIYLARYYDDRGEYEEAEKWALETNRLDNTIEESWLIFAKAKAKQGKTKEAVKVLSAYYDSSGSKKAEVLMSKIKRGLAY